MAEKSPEQLFGERMTRLQTAVALGTPDRVPTSLVMDSFAATAMGIPLSEYCADPDVAGRAALDTMEKLGDVDSIHFPVVIPKLLGMIWLSPVKVPGPDLPEGSLWQIDEQVRIQPEDYDRIVEQGWSAWLGQYIGKYLQAEAAAGQQIMVEGPRWAGEFVQRGYVPFAATAIDHPFEHLCGGRSISEFMLDLYHMPDKVQAAIEAIMVERREQARGMVRAIGPMGYWIGGWRTAPEFLSRKLWDRFVWPYMKELVEIVAEEGGIPILHYDANWDREIERLKELPKAKCLLALDGRTDIFRAREILDGHMCVMGDVPPALLSHGSVGEVEEYCSRLIRELGPSGFIMAMGCAIPPNAKFENVQAMVDSVR